jgi:hypothetical protein
LGAFSVFEDLAFVDLIEEMAGKRAPLLKMA